MIRQIVIASILASGVARAGTCPDDPDDCCLSHLDLSACKDLPYLSPDAVTAFDTCTKQIMVFVPECQRHLGDNYSRVVETLCDRTPIGAKRRPWCDVRDAHDRVPATRARNGWRIVFATLLFTLAALVAFICYVLPRIRASLDQDRRRP